MSFRCGVLVTVLFSSFLCAQAAQPSDANAKVNGTVPTYVPVHGFDPKRDAAADIEAAIAEAHRSGKRVLVDVGGDWCPYCHQMDQLFHDYPGLLELRDKNFITVAVYYGSDKRNKQALSQYPKVEGVPHFYILDGNGAVVHSQHLTEMRKNGKYDPEKMKNFFLKWSLAQGAAKSN